MRRSADVSFVIAAALFSLAGFARPASAQVPSRATIPRLEVPAREGTSPLPSQPATAPAAAAPAEAAPAEPAPVSAAPPPSGVTQVPPAAAPPATASSSQAVTADRRSAAGRFGLVLAGGQLGWLRNVEGGTATSDVVLEKPGSDGIPAKHIAEVKYTDIALETDLQSKPLNDWIAASWKGTFTRKSGSVQFMDFDYKAISELEFVNALVTETTMPALDLRSRDAARITVKLSPEYTRAKAGSGAKASGSQSSQGQKIWLLSNFRFEMSGLEGKKVNKIDAFTVRQVVTENRIGEQRDYQKEPSSIEFPNLKITLAAQSASTWTAWHEDFVMKGNNGQAQERNGAIIYLDPSLKTELGRVNLMNCGIFGLSPVKADAGSETTARVVADLYCERMELAVGGSSTLQ